MEKFFITANWFLFPNQLICSSPSVLGSEEKHNVLTYSDFFNDFGAFFLLFFYMIHGPLLSIGTLGPVQVHQLIDGPLCGTWVIFASSIVGRGKSSTLITYLQIDGKKVMQ